MTAKRLLTEASGVLEAPLARVWEALADQLLPDGRRAGRFTVEDAPGHTSTVEIAGHTIAFQGGWWYRGEWSLEAHPDGTRLVHRVYNVARRARWSVPLANRMFVGFDASTRAGFLDGLTRLGERLGCVTRPD
ncbi:hypothetical protein ACIBH1_00670 [Nonomuraea sp. NPDC050663]|uniref:hypothetical protein n=1 Tax=Nonomuraea sp. NPDC050663 TaxID=3364370 RepID=UPI0037B0F200